MGKIVFSEEVKGVSAGIMHVAEEVSIVAPTVLTVIIQGQSGSGKELIAQMIHNNSLRKDGPFVAIDCGAITESIAESEFFGYEKGAFTGAEGVKPGYFEIARGGTIFLDEITNLSETIQRKLLRAIQERKVRRLGARVDIPIDIRIIAASNVDFSKEVEAGRFRNDLYQRLNEFSIEVPPLKERKVDIPLLVQHFICEANTELNKSVKRVSDEVMEIFLEYDWPGNARELKNVIRRAVLISNSECIDAASLPCGIVKGSFAFTQTESEGSGLQEVRKEKMAEVEKAMIQNALKEAKNNKTRAAKLLKIDRVTLYSKIKSLGLKV